MNFAEEELQRHLEMVDPRESANATATMIRRHTAAPHDMRRAITTLQIAFKLAAILGRISAPCGAKGKSHSGKCDPGGPTRLIAYCG
ncbi:hypothetical protein IVA95_22600 [Bradyrhizobium sp. 157]|uniref:hypothetical protein n=1 Tax=Bradyrhizobium sp. 157 TaxID=2782631 RepID=UPI001FFA8723|nr:hypothetical protein [Bradyrhizobium sp. 157]MCK1640321.1 hypothetical protein [Bradyrhizobium sp. 157]